MNSGFAFWMGTTAASAVIRRALASNFSLISTTAVALRGANDGGVIGCARGGRAPRFISFLAITLTLCFAETSFAETNAKVNLSKRDGAYVVDLPTVLRLANAQNLDIKIAQEKLEEAKANQTSATSQFFINTKDNISLNHRGERDYGYAVFGKVVKGMDVVDQIEKTPTHTLRGDMGPMGDVPVTPVVIESVTISK